MAGNALARLCVDMRVLCGLGQEIFLVLGLKCWIRKSKGQNLTESK
jgi:hypothetical protein